VATVGMGNHKMPTYATKHASMSMVNMAIQLIALRTQLDTCLKCMWYNGPTRYNEIVSCT